MMPKLSLGRSILFYCLLVAVTACDSPDDQFGIVARVNGEPITLAQVEAKHDLLHLEWTETSRPSVDRLRQEYGEVLSDLIIQKLMEQELARLKEAVTSEDVAVLENEIRSDYPENAFEQVLVEEYISLDTWRNRLRAQLVQERFVNKVLTPTVQLDYKEAEEYYIAHATDFYLPPRVDLAIVRGENRQLVTEVIEKYAASADMDVLNATSGQVSVDRIRMRTDRMPASWLSVLEGLDPGQSSEVFEEDDEYRCLLLLERHEGVYLEPAQAYPLIEEILVEEKVGRAFEEWLGRSLEEARIEVSRHLLQEGTIPNEQSMEGES